MWANSPWRPADARRNISTTRTTQDSLTKLWTPCNVLKDDGVTSPQDVSELTDLLFLKMVQELGQEQGIAEPWRQSALQTLQGVKQLAHDMLMLLELGSSGSGASALLQEIVANASSFIKKPTTFNRLLSEIDTLDGYSAHQQGLGDLSEGLLQKNAEDKNSAAGQSFTPRPLIESRVAVLRPTLEDVIEDPAAGTGDFPIAARHWIREHNDISWMNSRSRSSTGAASRAWSPCRTRTAWRG